MSVRIHRNVIVSAGREILALNAYDVGGDLGVLHAPPYTAKLAG
jgi:hypothetical protein